MFRYRILMPLFLAVNISCNKEPQHQKNQNIEEFIFVDANVSPSVIINNSWKLKLPSSWEEIPSFYNDSSNHKLLVRSKLVNGLILLTKKNFDGSQREFLFEYYNSLQKDNLIISEVTTLLINDQRFVLFEATKEKQILLNWVTFKDNFIYNFSCVGFVDNYKRITEDCNSIISSLEIK